MRDVFNRLSSSLDQVLKGQEFLIERLSSENFPLFLLLTISKDKVGFAKLDNKISQNYLKALEEFRRLYGNHSSEWAYFDLTLVLCQTTPDNGYESRNEIEVDSYFCRKFVIDIGDYLEDELKGLPFVSPFPQMTVGGKRPFSAQTFLIKHGVSANLARYLIVPHSRGIQGIIKECIEGILGKPQWSEIESEQLLLKQEENIIGPKQIWLKYLEIENFRAYRGRHEFDLDASVVILFGPNGFGKTSLFDAIDFVCTGGVYRFDEKYGRKNPSRLIDVLKHIDSPSNTSFVRAITKIDSGEKSFERHLENRTEAKIDGAEKCNRTTTLMTITGLWQRPLDVRVDNLVHLFRATHIFSQEYQSLTSEFKKDSILSESIVTRMLAFQDYVEAINKTQRVSYELKRKIDDIEKEFKLIKDHLKTKQTDIKQLNQSIKSFKNLNVVMEIGKEIVNKISQISGIIVELPTRPDNDQIRQWRSLIIKQLSHVKQNLELIDELESNFPLILQDRIQLKEVTSILKQKKEKLGGIDNDYEKLTHKLAKSEEVLQLMIAEQRKLTNIKNNYKWLIEVRTEYEELKKQRAQKNKDYQKVKDNLEKLALKLEFKGATIKTLERDTSDIESNIRKIKSIQEELTQFDKYANDWIETTSRLRNLEVSLRKSEQEREELIEESKTFHDNLETITEYKQELVHNLTKLESSRSELQSLLGALETYIGDNICPACGTAHQSREVLLERLNIQRGHEPETIQKMRKLIEHTENQEYKLSKECSELESKIKRFDKEIANLQKEIAYLNKKENTYKQKANSLDISATYINILDELHTKQRELNETLSAKNRQLSEKKGELTIEQNEISTLTKQRDILERNLSNVEMRLTQLRDRTDIILNEANTKQISLELNNSKIENDLDKIDRSLSDLYKPIEIHQTKYQTQQKRVTTLKTKKNALQNEIQKSKNKKDEFKKRIRQTENLIKKLGLDTEIDFKEISSFNQRLKEQLQVTESLHSEIIDFELLIDEVEISATIARLKTEVANINKQISDIRKNQKQFEKWLIYFSKIGKELRSLQDTIIREYTKNYGPLASQIQRKLRSVYGFGGMVLHPEKGGIAVEVERAGHKLFRPTDYFSESQIQIVMLSLFFSLTMSQTWSAFAPILLDDPVEHFDDLNAYSLLDLIESFALQYGKERQIIISTCDEHLYKLMRQKFCRLKDAAIFYHFESIGEKGPKVRKIRNE
ncbi:MAG TPA: hypothetical protein ENI23_00995 [bacterium]|nr:hypothetical protein [bacterium]